MKLDLVDPVPVAVVRAQLRRMGVGETPPVERLASELFAEGEQRLLVPGRAFPAQRLEQRAVLRDEVVAPKRRRLVFDAGADALA
jgi:hypothetical protein